MAYKVSKIFLSKWINNLIDCPPLLETLNLHDPSVDTRNDAVFYLKTPRTNLLSNSSVYIMCNKYNTVLKSKFDLFNSSVANIRSVLVLLTFHVFSFFMLIFSLLLFFAFLIVVMGDCFINCYLYFCCPACNWYGAL